MIWAIVILATILATVGFFEWRSWKKPLPRALEDTPSFWADRADPAVPNKERPAGQREIADQQGDEGEGFDFAFVGGHSVPLAGAAPSGS